MPRDLIVLSRTVLLLESTLPRIAPGFSVSETLSAHAKEVIHAATKSSGSTLPRLKYELAVTVQELPALFARTLQHARAGHAKFEIPIAPSPELRQAISCGSGSIALALVTLGLYVAASLLMQHSVGPMVGGIPLLSIGGYGVAAWFTVRVARAARRGGV